MPCFDDLPKVLRSEALVKLLSRYYARQRLVVAYSGGVDSHVLLHLCAEIRSQYLPDLEVRALHVNHGLQQQAISWQQHCARVCDALAIDCISATVDARASNGESPEEAARNARRQVFQQHLSPDDLLLTAQHADDQLETMLLQLFRGAGVNGLAAMPVVAELGAGLMFRPLLAIQRQTILDYARQHHLVWVEDPSNQDERFQRNYLRRQIIPRLLEQWPGLRGSVGRSARHCAEAVRLLDTTAHTWLQQHTETDARKLAIDKLMAIKSSDQRRLVLRTWIRSNQFRVPGGLVLQRVFDEVIPARGDRNPLVCWGDAEIRRYRDQLYLLPRLPELVPEMLEWPAGKDELSLGSPLGLLQIDQRVLEQCSAARTLFEGPLQVRFFSALSNLRLDCGRGGHKNLRKLFQEKAVPSWVRPYFPVLYVDQQPLLVPGVWYDLTRLGVSSLNRSLIRWVNYDLGWKGSD